MFVKSVIVCLFVLSFLFPLSPASTSSSVPSSTFSFSPFFSFVPLFLSLLYSHWKNRMLFQSSGNPSGLHWTFFTTLHHNSLCKLHQCLVLYGYCDETWIAFMYTMRFCTAFLCSVYIGMVYSTVPIVVVYRVYLYTVECRDADILNVQNFTQPYFGWKKITPKRASIFSKFELWKVALIYK